MADKQRVQNQDLIHQNPPCPKCGFSGVGNSDSQKRRLPFSINSEQPDAKKLFLASGTGSGNSSNAAPKTAPNPNLVMPCSATGLPPRPPPRRRQNLYPISSPSHSPLESARTSGSLLGVSSNASPKTTPKRDSATGLPPRPPPRRLQNLAPISSPSHSPLESARTSGWVPGVSSNASPKSAPKHDSAMPCSAIGRPPRPPPYRRLKSTPILSAEKSLSRTSANSDNSKG
ncbi:uncharacterized protein DKFZp434B061-like [Morus notabilis]|uniref:uncharacterized protein DKFZp434B061-like n=1 Tax=Morus notabilis TaxID=981085 RepID=UPI000CED3351|nr:uncharacterized protein DKFZp434B061-like [Morus notabilis]